jgi:hypothetical protein
MALNEPVEHAQKTTGVVTAKALVTVIRAARGGDVSLHGHTAHDRASYSDAFVFEVTATDRGNGRDKVERRTTIEVPGYVSNGHTSTREERTFDGSKVVAYREVYRPLKGHWWLSYQADRVLDILELLPSDAEVSFHVYLDAGTCELLVRAEAPMNYERIQGLHGDALYLEASYLVRGKRKVRRFLLDTQVSAHNSARFGSPR